MCARVYVCVCVRVCLCVCVCGCVCERECRRAVAVQAAYMRVVYAGVWMDGWVCLSVWVCV